MNQEVLKVNIRCGLSTEFRNKENLSGDTRAFGNSFYPAGIHAADLIKHILNGRAFTVGYFKGKSRKNETFISAGLIALDYDANVSVADALKNPFVQQNAMLVYATPSSTPDCYKTRVLFALSEAVETPERYRAIARAVAEYIGLPADAASWKPAQLYYGSTNRIEQPHINLEALLPIEFAGALTYDHALDEYLRFINPPVTTKIDPGSSQADQIARRRLEKAIGELASATDGDRHGLLISKACYLFGLIKGGWPLTDTEVESQLTGAMYTNGALSKYGEQEVQRCINDARRMADPRPVEIQERQEQPYDAPAVDLNRAPADSPSEWFSDVPDSWREAAMNVLKPSHAPIIELVFKAHTAGLINRQEFTAPDLQAANESLGFDIPQTTLYRGLEELSGEFFPICHTIESALNTIVGHFGKNSDRGRKATRYGLNPYAEVKSKLLEYANPRIYERASQTPDGDILLPPTAGMVEAIGVGEGAATTAADLHKALTPAYQAQGNREQAAVKRATKRRARLIQDLDNWQSTPLPEGWPLGSAANYRAAYAHARVKANPDAQTSRAQLAEMTGIDPHSVKALRARAGIHAESQETHVEVQSFDELRAYGKDKRAFAKSVTAKTADGQTVTPDAQESYSAFITRQRSIGAQVTAHFQHTSTHKIVREAPPIPAERKPREHIEGMVSRPATHTNEPKRERYYGRGYDPRWVMAQLKLALKLLGWKTHSSGQLFDEESGEFAPDNARQIIEILIGRDISHQCEESWEGFLADAVELGAVSHIQPRTQRPAGEGWHEVPLRRIA